MIYKFRRFSNLECAFGVVLVGFRFSDSVGHVRVLLCNRPLDSNHTDMERMKLPPLFTSLVYGLLWSWYSDCSVRRIIPTVDGSGSVVTFKGFLRRFFPAEES
jgi:hypothetical protein